MDEPGVMTFMGTEMSQPWEDLYIWEQFFKLHPIRTFVELGTGNGGMSLFLASQCYQRKIYFRTFDNQRFFDFSQGIPVLLGMQDCFHFVDLFSEEAMQQIVEIVESLPHPLAIFFDDGDKPREWSLYAPLTRPGDYCIVHDWGEEFMPSDVGDLKVERILTRLCDSRTYDWKSMWFRRLP